MDYYKAKRRLIIDLETLFLQNKGGRIELAGILYAMVKRYGFGERSIVTVLKLFEERGIISVKDDTIYVLGGENGQTTKKKE
jgi:hypothetical protein